MNRSTSGAAFVAPKISWVPNTMRGVLLLVLLSREGRYAEAKTLAKDTISISRRVFGGRIR